MGSGTMDLDRYKLDSFFGRDTVVHTTGLMFGQRIRETTRWTRQRMLGAGAFGKVRSEKERGTNQLRAVKVIYKILFDAQELEASVQLQDHPNLFVSFLGWFEDPYTIYITMEYLQDGDLAGYMRESRSNGAAEIHDITAQVLNGLAVLHERGMAHRNLKPQNILIACRSPIWIKLSDFGVSDATLRISLIWGCGTNCYHAPEVLGFIPRGTAKVSFTNAVDMWALGAIVHEILTFKVPFHERHRRVYKETDLTTGDQRYSISEYTITVDPKVLSDYCRGSAFPSRYLEENGVSEDGIDFVQSLMVVNPKKRVSALVALKSPWLIGAATLKCQFLLLGVSVSAENARRLLVEHQRATIIRILETPNICKIWALLCMAVSTGCLEVVRVLSRVVEDINSSYGTGGVSLLQAAAENGQIPAMKLLFDLGADIGGPSTHQNGPNALYSAAKKGQLAALKMLLDRGVSADAVTTGRDSQSALHAAARAGDLNVVRTLLDSGANIDGVSASPNGQTALSAAAEGAHLCVVQMLLDWGASIDAAPIGPDGQTALHTAAINGNIDVMTLLLDSGASVNAVSTSHNGQSALHGATMGGNLDAIKLLLDRGASVAVAATNPNGQSVLHLAAAGGNIPAMKLLLERGAILNVASASPNGQTALHAAANGGHIHAMKLLLDRGAILAGASLSNNNQTALHAAAAGGHLHAMKLLLSRGAAANAATEVQYSLVYSKDIIA